MSLLTPPPTGARPPPDNRHPIIRFLDTHLEHGGLQPHTYDMLHRVLQAVGEISLHLFPHSEALPTTSRRRVETLAGMIADTFYVFGEHIDVRLKRAKRASEELPDLAVHQQDVREKNLDVWRQKLATLHQPSNNDLNLYRYFLAYFDSQVHEPFLQLHRVEPEHNSWKLRHWLNHVRECIVFLVENVEEANQLVRDLDTEFAFGSWTMNEVETQLPSIETTKSDQEAIAQRNKTKEMMEQLDDFFEDPKSPSYKISPGAGEDGSPMPRVFTGSFFELQDSVENLQLHRTNLSADSDLDADGSVRVKDFALCTPEVLPSPATLLGRREALTVRTPAWEQRMTGGQVVQSRRPHDRSRAQTVDERGGGLDAWLLESPSPDRALGRAGSVHSRVLHRQHTL